jgi:transcription antitermination protein NusB
VTARTRGREYALQVLYELDASGKDASAALDAYWLNFETTGRPAGSPEPDPAIKTFTEQLVTGVAKNVAALDSAIERCSTNWRLDRMPRVDRNVLRLACFELMHTADVPVKVVINEAIELGKRYGSEESGAFINGILDKLSTDVRKAAPRGTTRDEEGQDS